MQEKGYYNRVVSGNISQRIEAVSYTHLDSNPFSLSLTRNMENLYLSYENR